MASSANLELFDSEFIQDFPKINITAIADYNQNLIIGDSQGHIQAYKKENSKFVEYYNKQFKNKIDKIIVIPNLNILYILSGGNLFLNGLPVFNDINPKESDKESKDFKDVAKIIENQNPKNENELMIISKKKKILFFYYQTEMQRLLYKEYIDKDGKQLVINLEEIPEKIVWNGNSICYCTKTKVNIISIKTENKVTTVVESPQDLPVENILYLQSSWVIVTGGCGLFFDTEGQPMSKNMVSFNQAHPTIDLALFNDLHIVALCEKNIDIYDSNDGNCVQELNIENNFADSFKKFLTVGNNRILIVTSNKKDEKAKDYISYLWEIREFSFEKQIKLALKSNQIEKAYGILNNKLDYNMEKFKFLESFYYGCAWNSINKKNIEGYEEAQKYLCLTNFNPFELIYHFISLLKIKPIHVGFEDINKLNPDILNAQIISKDGNIDDTTKSALRMLINVLQTKKTYILKTNNLLNTLNEKGKSKALAFELAKNNSLKFESSENCKINLKDVQPKDIKLFEAIKIINEALIKAMVLLNEDLLLIEDIIEDDQYKTNYSEEFLLNINTFTSGMTLAYIYKKNKKYKEAINLLEPYIDNIKEENENKHAVYLLKKILAGFGKNKEYTEIFEQGLKILLKNHYMDAFDMLLYHELLTVDYFLENILVDEPGNLEKREIFLKMLCDEIKYNYSNEKYQTLYLELLVNKLFTKLKKDSMDLDKQSEEFKKEYNDLKELFKKYKNYNKGKLLEIVKNSWMNDIEIYLLSQMSKNDEAIKKYIELIKAKNKTFEDIREFCKLNYNNDMDIFKKYFKNLREKYDDKKYEDMKPLFKKEMLKIIDLFISGELLDLEVRKNKNKLELLNILNPKEILNLIPKEWKLNENLDENDKNKTIYNLMHFYLKEYAIINNNYKRLENLAKMDLTYKQKKLYELRDKHVALDINSSCFLCGKKITNNTQFLVYPNGHIYHSRCSPDLYTEVKTGKNFKNFDY